MQIDCVVIYIILFLKKDFRGREMIPGRISVGGRSVKSIVSFIFFLFYFILFLTQYFLSSSNHSGIDTLPIAALLWVR
jgi:hypothetical protein